MKAISIKQPWASLIISGVKDIENRTWKSDYTGPLLIHASKGWSKSGYDFISDKMDTYVPCKDSHVFGAIIGTVDMVGCVDESESKWFFGDWGFEFENAKEFKNPIPWRGQLGFFNVPDSVLDLEKRGAR
ncbi:ASCH domain-containing protein [bacterium]|nr:ASCH domain-containing protein [bacterium]